MHSPSRVVFIILLVSSIFFTIFSGPIGYAWDTWNFIYTGVFGEGLFQPGEYLQDYWLHLRPLQYFFDVYLLHHVLKLWLFPRLAHFVTLCYAAIFVICFGKLLEKIFPRERFFILGTSLLTFFYTPVFASTFILHHNTMYISAAAFCLTGILLIKFSDSHSFFSGFWYIVVAFLCYFISVFAEELFIVSIFVFPIMVFFGISWPPSTNFFMKVKHVLLRTVLPVAGMLGGVLLVKYQIVQYIGEKTNFSGLFAFDRLWHFFEMDIMYGVDAFRHVIHSNYRYLALFILITVFVLVRRHKPEISLPGNWIAAFLIGAGLFFLGRVPFMVLQGYVVKPFAPDYFTGRQFSSAFGFVLIVSTWWLLKKNTWFHRVYQFFLIVLFALNFAYDCILADSWKEASRLQKSLYTSLLEKCPDVEDGTAFIFLLDRYINTSNNRALVFHGIDSIYVLLPIIYQNQTLQGRVTFSANITQRDKKRTTIITRDYIRPAIPSDMIQGHSPHIPVEKIVILTPENGKFEFVEWRKSDNALNAIWAESYFEITKTALQRMARDNIPEKIMAQLKPLKHRAFFREEFLNGLQELLGETDTAHYQDRILQHTWNWTQQYFEFTNAHWQRLKAAGVPDIILELLAELKGQRFVRDEDFLWEVADRISDENMQRYRDLLVAHEWKTVESVEVVRSNKALIKPTRVDNNFITYLSRLPD